MNSKTVTILFLIFFFPIGLFLMWKNQHFSQTARIIVSSVFGLLIVIGMFSPEEETVPTTTTVQADETDKEKEEPKEEPKETVEQEEEAPKEEEPVEEEVAEEEVVEETEEETAPPAEEPKEEEKEEEPQLSTSQKNAIRHAENYIDYTAFSKQGLITQLEYEGYSTEDATFAVDNIIVDWREQAVRHAQAYIDYSPFSRQGLIDQLLYEGHSQEDADFAATEVGL